MKVLFFGTPEIAVPTLAALCAEKAHDITVVTRIDKPRGRGLHVKPSAVKEFALSNKLKVLQPVSVKEEVFLFETEKSAFDLIIVVSFGQIMPERLIKAAKYGSINSHFSLLPKLRGAAPINRAIMNGEAETGVTVQFIEYKLDSGDVMLSETVDIRPEDNAGSLGARLAELSATLILEAVVLIEKGRAPRRPQDHSKATQAPKITKQDSHIDWEKQAEEINNLVRGLSRLPGASACLGGHNIKILKSALSIEKIKLEPGRIGAVSGGGVPVGTGSGVLRLLELKPEGKRLMPAADFARGHKIEAEVFDRFKKENCR